MSVSADGNTTQSVLSFTPTAADHGLILTCKASNQRIPFSEMQHTWMLRVLYPPKVTLALGHGLDASDIKEGADVYFDCHLTANPWVSALVSCCIYRIRAEECLQLLKVARKFKNTYVTEHYSIVCI